MVKRTDHSLVPPTSSSIIWYFISLKRERERDGWREKERKLNNDHRSLTIHDSDSSSLRKQDGKELRKDREREREKRGEMERGGFREKEISAQASSTYHETANYH